MSAIPFVRPEWIGPPEPELWRKVEGYDEDGIYTWAVATADDIRWFTNETDARSWFAEVTA